MDRLFVALALLALGCQAAARTPAPSFTDADRQAIDAQRAAFAAAANANDMAAAAALYAEDATVLPPNGPAVTGRLAIEQLLRSFPPIGDMKLTPVDLVGAADFAVARGVFSMNMMPPGAPAAIADTGKFIELWRRQPDGRWLIAWDMFNSDIPLPAPPAK
jgi:uncharacterized protein (TIGR02246 family)